VKQGLTSFVRPCLFLDICIMDGKTRATIKPGMLVNIILKKDQRSGELTEGIVKDLLTSAPYHHRGIKVRLMDGQIGRVAEIIEDDF
jgi:uncharacterized repeat protein (TIGR03833 family)